MVLCYLGCIGIVAAMAIVRVHLDEKGKEAVEKLGGTVHERLKGPLAEEAFWVDLRGAPIDDADVIALIPQLKRMTYVEGIQIDSGEITEQVLPHFRGFDKIFFVDMSGTQISTRRMHEFGSQEQIAIGLGYYGSGRTRTDDIKTPERN